MSVAAKIDFGWIKQAWALFSAQSGVWVGPENDPAPAGVWPPPPRVF